MLANFEHRSHEGSFGPGRRVYCPLRIGRGGNGIALARREGTVCIPARSTRGLASAEQEEFVDALSNGNSRYRALISAIAQACRALRQTRSDRDDRRTITGSTWAGGSAAARFGRPTSSLPDGSGYVRTFATTERKRPVRG